MSQPVRSGPRRLLILACCAATAAVLTAQSPQTPAPPPQKPFRTGTNLVRVDVYATRGGVPVQDLTAADFEVSEDNAPQKIDSFEHIVVTPAGPQDTLVEPNSTRQSLQLAADPHRRVFVIFLDTGQVDVSGSHAIKEPLIDLLTRVLGPDDLVGVMTPDMSASAIAFGRKTEVIEDQLRTNWAWGRRDSIVLDAQERKYADCFPPKPSETTLVSALAGALIARRRERIALDSLQDLSRYMASLREGRTAVVTVTDGWLLYRPDATLTVPRKDKNGQNMDPIPGTPTPTGVGPGGTLTKNSGQNYTSDDRTECERDLMDLAMQDNQVYFRDIMGEANRANVSFYTVDPRGLAAFDSPIGPDPPPSPSQDYANLIARAESLRTLALNTDGLALLANNDLKKQLRRVADDLTSYYLLGYYSTNSKLDGGFRTIKVRSTKPGLEIRARRGYRAATQAEVNAARAASDAPVDPAKVAVTRALGFVESDARAAGHTSVRGDGEPLIFHRGPSTGNQVTPAQGRTFPRSDRIRLELEAAASEPGWTGALLDRNGATLPIPVPTAERTDAATGQRWLTADLTLAPLGLGDYVIALTTAKGTEQKRTLVAIRVTQ